MPGGSAASWSRSAPRRLTTGCVTSSGGATAVLIGWRATTIDVDLKLEPELDEVLCALPSIKNSLSVNVELASPGDFIPLPEGWRERSPSIGREGRLDFRHFDLYSQALAKIERAHAQDLEDVREMLERELDRSLAAGARSSARSRPSSIAFPRSTRRTSRAESPTQPVDERPATASDVSATAKLVLPTHLACEPESDRLPAEGCRTGDRNEQAPGDDDGARRIRVVVDRDAALEHAEAPAGRGPVRRRPCTARCGLGSLSERTSRSCSAAPPRPPCSRRPSGRWHTGAAA